MPPREFEVRLAELLFLPSGGRLRDRFPDPIRQLLEHEIVGRERARLRQFEFDSTEPSGDPQGAAASLVRDRILSALPVREETGPLRAVGPLRVRRPVEEPPQLIR